jgi:hypothetical protein
VRDIAGRGHGAVAGRVIVACVQAPVLGTVRRERWPFAHAGVDGVGQRLAINQVRPGHNHAQRPAGALDDQAAKV